MRIDKMILAICVVFVASGSTFAQSRFSMEILGGEAFNGLNSGGYMSNWANGWTIGAGLIYRALPNTDVIMNLSYDRFPYRGGHLELVFPAIAGLTYSVSGKPSTAQEASLGLRFAAPIRHVIPFFSLRAGLRNFFTGQIEVIQRLGASPQEVSESGSTGSGGSALDFFSAVGFGLMVPINQEVDLSIEGSYSHTFAPDEDFLPLTAKVQFHL